MKLKNITFGHVLGQSGIQGFFGEKDEYPHHKLYKILFLFFGFSFKRMTFVAKTTSLHPRIFPEASQTKLKNVYKLSEWFPRSIWVSLKSFIQGYVLNAMGIPTPGAMTLLRLKKWQTRTEPFQISFMPMEQTLGKKIIETEMFCDLLREYLPPENHPYGVQINVSCPNTGHEQTEALHDWIAIANVFNKHMPTTPLIFKLDLTIEQSIVSSLQKHCDAICMGNTVAFGKIPNEINWGKLFFKGISPIGKRFGETFKGGLSGKPLLPVLVRWLEKMDEVDPTVTIIAGGGITTKEDIKCVAKNKCVKAIALGSVAITRPWRLQTLISYGNQIFKK